MLYMIRSDVGLKFFVQNTNMMNGKVRFVIAKRNFEKKKKKKT